MPGFEIDHNSRRKKKESQRVRGIKLSVSYESHREGDSGKTGLGEGGMKAYIGQKGKTLKKQFSKHEENVRSLAHTVS